MRRPTAGCDELFHKVGPGAQRSELYEAWEAAGKVTDSHMPLRGVLLMCGLVRVPGPVTRPLSIFALVQAALNTCSLRWERCSASFGAHVQLRGTRSFLVFRCGHAKRCIDWSKFPCSDYHNRVHVRVRESSWVL